MKDELVSIIMPSWNTGRFISDSIQSVLDQTYKNFELIIVDDASTDNTDKIINSFKDTRIKYYKNSQNEGAAKSRNLALRKARGKWIAFLDSDDLWMPEKLEKQIKFMKENNISFSYHNYEKIDEFSNPIGILVTGPKRITKKMMYRYGYPGCLTFMYEAKRFGLIQIKDIKKNNDYAILLKLCKLSDCFLLNECLAKYRIRKVSISHDKFFKKFKSHVDLFFVCDNKKYIISLFYAIQNMIFGLNKKIKYEKKVN